MNVGFFDAITQAFLVALESGFLVLHQWAVVILSGLAGFVWIMTVLPMAAAGLSPAGIIAAMAALLLGIGIYWYLIVHMHSIAMGFFDLFAGFGASVSGGVFTAEQFRHPSAIFEMAFITSRPLVDFLNNQTGWAVLWNGHMVFLYAVALLFIVGAFLWVIKDVMITLIEFYFSLMVLPVLFPWGLLTHTSFFAEFAVSWVMSSCIRVMLLAAVLGIAVPIFQAFGPTMTPGQDPTLYSAVIMACAALVFAILAHHIPLRAAAIGGRGMALALPGTIMVPPGTGAALRTAANGLTGAGTWAGSKIGGGSGVGRGAPSVYGRTTYRGGP